MRRIHQEDLCQALGIDPDGARGRAKYETGGGPSLRRIAALLDAYAADPAGQLDRLVAIVTFTVAIGNADAHGKNLALLHPTPETIALAPLYDTVPTALWPNLRSDAAMAVGGQLSLAGVTLADILREARSWPHPEDRARAIAMETIERLNGALDAGAIPAGSAVATLVRKRTERLPA